MCDANATPLAILYGDIVNRMLSALAFAAHKHRDQRRKDTAATPYINHPIALANVLANEAHIDDETILIAAILHDTIEDTDTTEQKKPRKHQLDLHP